MFKFLSLSSQFLLIVVVRSLQLSKGKLAIVLCLCCTSCAYFQHDKIPEPMRSPMPNQPQITPLSESQKTLPQTRFTTAPASSANISSVTGEATSTTPVFKSNQPVSINVDGLPLPAFINEIYGNVLGVSFQIDAALQTKTDLVTLRIIEPQQPAELYRLARQVLSNYGVGIVPQGDFLRFIPSNQATLTEPPLIFTGQTLPEVPASHRPIFQFVPLTVIRNTQVTSFLRATYNSPQLQITEDAERNAVMLFGPPALVRQALEAIRYFDQPFMRGRHSMRIEPVFFAADQLSTQLTTVLQTEGYAIGNTVVFLPIKATNALIVFAADPKTLEHVKQWAATLDTPGRLENKSGLFFYPVQNTQAKELVEVLTPLLNTVIASPTPTAANVTATTGTGATTPGIVPATSGQAINQTKKLVVDNLHNALIFQGEVEEWARLLPVLKEMDKPAKLTLIEVTIAEVTLNDQEQFGIEWIARGANINDYRGTIGTLGGLGVGSGSLTYTLVNSLGQTRAILSALASNSRVNILSSPRLMVKSGESASMSVGTEVPILTSQSVDSTAGSRQGTTGILQQIQYRHTGVNLQVKPVVHAGNRIDLDISQEVSNAEVNTTSNISSPSISNRSIQTKLSLSDGGSVMLAGMIQSSVSRGNTGVPILKDIPLLGQLFRADKQNYSRTELIIVIVPYVISNDREAQEMTDIFRRSLHIDAPDSKPSTPADKDTKKPEAPVQPPAHEKRI